MKRILIGVLCVCILLCGCTAVPPQPTQTDPPETETIDREPVVPLLEQGIAAGESGNLLYIPNDAVEDMPCPEVRLFGDGLLLSAYIRNQYVLRYISLEDGDLLAEYAISASPGVKVQIGTDGIGLLDSGTNRFILLREDLTVERTQTISGEGDSWCLSPGLDVLYRFYDEGLLARDLQTGEERWIVEHAVFTRVIGPETEYVLFEYTDRQDQRTRIGCLDLSDGTLELVTSPGEVSTGFRRGETLLWRKDGTGGEYILTDGDQTASFTWTDSAVTLLASQKHLLLTDPSGRNLQLYDTEGRFVSACILPEAEYGSVGTDLVWSESWKGYFFTDNIEGTCRLMFWDIDAETQGEDLEWIREDQPQNPQPVMEAAFYERAEAMSERFGVRILIAEQCEQEYSHYHAVLLTEPSVVSRALDILEGCLEMYPEGFLRQLPYGTVDHVQIELVGSLFLTDDNANQPDSTAAFVTEQDGYISIVIDGYILDSETVYHEFSHVIDRRLAWDAQVREEAIYSEEGWLALQPEGFAYARSYREMPEEILQFSGSGYFAEDYAMTYPTEDRATLIAAAMTQSPTLERNPGMQEKMKYYARCIRDCFDTEGWPEATAWELLLQTNG